MAYHMISAFHNTRQRHATGIISTFEYHNVQKYKHLLLLLPPSSSGVPGEGLGCSTPPHRNSKRPSKIVPNWTRLWKLLKIAEFRTPPPQYVRKKGSKILKLPSVRNCFTLAMTNKLVVIINSLKVPQIKKILLYEMKFLVPNYSCYRTPD